MHACMWIFNPSTGFLIKKIFLFYNFWLGLQWSLYFRKSFYEIWITDEWSLVFYSMDAHFEENTVVGSAVLLCSQ